MRRYRNQSGRKVSPARLARARRGGIAMGMMAQSGRRSAFRGQTGDGVNSIDGINPAEGYTAPRVKQRRKFRGATGGRFTSHWGGLRIR
jgi:hypothetical protein